MKNIKENKKSGTFTVQTANGKTRVFKTRRGAENHAAKFARTIQIPMIVTAKTYFWESGSSAKNRRYNEDRRNGEIQNFINALAHIPTIEIEGDYRETCSNVYKSMSYRVKRGESFENTNLTGLIGECARWGITLVK